MFATPSELELQYFPVREVIRPLQPVNIRLFYAEVWHLVIIPYIGAREEQTITELAVF